MKIVAINGSPRKEGNTYYAISVVAKELEKEGIEVDIIHVGNEQFRGCVSCFNCMSTQSGKCVIKNDKVNELIDQMKEADGIILGAPNYFGDMPGTMKSFLDRALFAINYGSPEPGLRQKVGASVVAQRRTGGLGVYNALNNYLIESEMIIPGSNYWNIINGMMPGEAEKDEEGIQTMRILGKNMAYVLKLQEAAKGKVKAPAHEAKIMTNFIR